MTIAVLRLLTYNICYGGAGREDALATAIRAASPDLAILQEAERPDIVERLARTTGMAEWGAAAGRSLAFLSRIPIAAYEWHRARWAQHAYLEIVPRDVDVRIFGLHLSAIHSNVTERRRAYELRALLRRIAAQHDGFHIVTGDFNTVAPGEQLDLRRLPPRLRAIVWLTGRTIRWVTIRMMIEAGYADAFRLLHPDEEGFTFPTWDPHVRLDYAFVPSAYTNRVKACEIGTALPGGRSASDHFPLTCELA
jgi:exodeoxyribonuclease III